MTDQRREHPRYAIELDAEILLGETKVIGRTRDVSRGGFCMLAREPLQLSTVCDVSLSLVFSENQFSEQLHIPATIVWCTPTQGVFQIGFKFAQLTPEYRNYLTLFMQFLEGGEHDGEAEEEEPEPSTDDT